MTSILERQRLKSPEECWKFSTLAIPRKVKHELERLTEGKEQNPNQVSSKNLTFQRVRE